MKTYSLIQLTKSVMSCSVKRCDSNGAKDHAGRVVRSLEIGHSQKTYIDSLYLQMNSIVKIFCKFQNKFHKFLLKFSSIRWMIETFHADE